MNFVVLRIQQNKERKKQTMDTSKKIALFSVLKKDNPDINPIAEKLIGLGWEIFGSAGTVKYLKAGNQEAKDICEFTGQGPILRHQVVTLHPSIHGGLLARSSDDYTELDQLGYRRIDLVYVGLYDLEGAIAALDATDESVNEATDMGGVALLTSACKGGKIPICDPADWPEVLQQLEENGDVNAQTRQKLIAKAYLACAMYRMLSAEYFSRGEFKAMFGRLVSTTLYGENAWQAPARLFQRLGVPTDLLGLPAFNLAQGIAPSYNNFADLDRLLQTLTHVVAGWQKNYGQIPYAGIGVKHGNACGAAVNETDKMAVIKGIVMGDPKAIFGGLLMLNFAVGEAEAEMILTHGMPDGKRRILDGIIAPSFTVEAIKLLERKKDKCRLLSNPDLANLSLDRMTRFRYVRNGWLEQPNYTFVPDFNDPAMQVFGFRDVEVEMNLLLAWAIGSTSNSNTITIVKDLELEGNGVSRQNRVGAACLAIDIAKDSVHSLDGSCVYSDSFFPFLDGPAVLIGAGVKAIFSTSGSVNDAKVQTLCQAAGVTLYQLPDKDARGFFGH